MAKILTSDELKLKASKSIISDYYTTSGNGQNNPVLLPSGNYADIKALFKDHTFNTHVSKLVNGCTVNGWKIVKSDDITKRNKEYEAKFIEMGYSLIERSLFLATIMYRNSFVEVEREGTARTPKKVHMLDTNQMFIRVTPHGEIQGYSQIPQSTQWVKNAVVPIEFTNDECVHIPVNQIDTNPYGFVDTETIRHLVFYKNYIEKYLTDMFSKNKFRDLWVVKNQIGANGMKDLIANVKLGDVQPDKSFIVEGDVSKTTLRDMKELEYLQKLISNFEDKIARFIMIPPILGGDVDGSARSTGEYEVRYDFSTTVASWQNIIATHISEKLFPLIGFNGHVLVYNNFDKIDHEKALRIAAQLHGLGYSPESIHYYLLSNGIEIPDDKLPEKVESNKSLTQSLQNQNAPSRATNTTTFAGNQKSGSDSQTRQNQL